MGYGIAAFGSLELGGSLTILTTDLVTFLGAFKLK